MESQIERECVNINYYVQIYNQCDIFNEINILEQKMSI